MKVRFGKIGYPLYCDAGPYAGQMRIDLTIRLYLLAEEYARYEGSESPQITLHESGGGDLQSGSTAEPSGELPAADVVAAGDARTAGRPDRRGAGQRAPDRSRYPRARHPPPARAGRARRIRARIPCEGVPR